MSTHQSTPGLGWQHTCGTQPSKAMPTCTSQHGQLTSPSASKTQALAGASICAACDWAVQQALQPRPASPTQRDPGGLAAPWAILTGLRELALGPCPAVCNEGAASHSAAQRADEASAAPCSIIKQGPLLRASPSLQVHQKSETRAGVHQPCVASAEATV